MPQIRATISGLEAPAIRDVIEQFFIEEMKICHEFIDSSNGRRGHLADVIFLASTILQGTAAGFHIADRIGLVSRAERFLRRVRLLQASGGKTTLEIGGAAPIDLQNADPGQLADHLLRLKSDGASTDKSQSC